MVSNVNYFELAKEDWLDVKLGDKRLNERASIIGAEFLSNPFVSPPKMMKSFKAIKAFYRFMDSERFHMRSLFLLMLRRQKRNLQGIRLFLQFKTQ